MKITDERETEKSNNKNKDRKEQGGTAAMVKGTMLRWSADV